MNCIFCGHTASQLHHIIAKSKGGTNHPLNLAILCFDCHYQWHHGTDTELVDKIKAVCYNQIINDLDKCWSGKYQPAIITRLKNGEWK